MEGCLQPGIPRDPDARNGTLKPMDNIASPVHIEPAVPPPTASPPVIAQRAPFLGWLARHLVLPLIPFLVGSGIRMVRAGEVSISAFDPAELSFSLAMFCILGVVAARRLQAQEYREAAFVVFVIGVAIFMSMFAFSVVESDRLAELQENALDSTVQALKSGKAMSGGDLEAIAKVRERESCQRISFAILCVVICCGALFVVAGFAARDRYGLGEE